MPQAENTTNAGNRKHRKAVISEQNGDLSRSPCNTTVRPPCKNVANDLKTYSKDAVRPTKVTPGGEEAISETLQLASPPAIESTSLSDSCTVVVGPMLHGNGPFTGFYCAEHEDFALTITNQRKLGSCGNADSRHPPLDTQVRGS